jgi:hypothetical protein
MTRHHHHHHAATIALTLALTATLAPAAWADPAPLANAEATIAANTRWSTPTRPNPDEQTVTGATANSGPCSEVCSGGAGSYGSASQPSSAPGDSHARLVRSGPGVRTYFVGTTPSAARAGTRGGGFDWGDAGIGAAGGVALSILGLGSALAVSGRRTRRQTVRQA